MFDELIAKGIWFTPRMERVTSGLNTTMRTYVFLTFTAYERSLSMKKGRSRMKMVVQKHTQLIGALTVVAGKKMSVDFFSGDWGRKCLEVIPMADSTNLILFQQPSPTLSCQPY